jgi:beta-galactosidase
MNSSSVRCLLVAVCGLALSAGIPRASGAPAGAIPISGERRLNFDADWRFLKGDAPGAKQPGFDDSHWTVLRLPHD